MGNKSADYFFNHDQGEHTGPTIIRYMSTNGRPHQFGGSSQMAGDWSVTPQAFYFEAQEGEIYHLNRAIIHMSVDRGMAPDKFGNGPALTNGIKFYLYKADLNIYFDALDGLPMVINEDWGRICYDTNIADYGVGNQIFGARWTFRKDGGPIHLDPGDKIVAYLNDDLSLGTRGITDFTIKIAGYMIKGNPYPASPQPSITY